MKISASSVYRFMQCPGSAHLEDVLSDEAKYNAFVEASSFGRKTHAAGEYLITETIKKPGKMTVSQALKKAGFEKEDFRYLDAENAVKLYKKYVAQIVKKRKAPGKSLNIETKFRTTIDGYDCVFKADAFLTGANEGRLYIDFVDLKTGNFDYSKSAFEQMRFSAEIFIVSQMSKTHPEKTIIVTNWIIQPNFYDETKQLVCETFAGTYESYCNDLQERISFIKHNASLFCTGSHCAFCPALIHCPDKQAFMYLIENTERVFADNMDDMSSELLEYIWLRKASFESFLKAIDARVLQLLESGTRFNRLYKKLTYGHRKWIDKKAVMKKLSFLGDKLFKPREILSPAQVEKLAGKENIKDLYDKPELYKVAELEAMDISEVF